MKTALYLFLAALRYVNAQGSLSFASPSADTSPLGNVALWQQAIAMDIAKNLTSTHTNQQFYSQLAWWQSLENSSNSIQSGHAGGIQPGPDVSRALQTLDIYPIRFDQAQASDPKRNPSKKSLVDI